MRERTPTPDVTEVLLQHCSTDPSATSELTLVLYDELRRLARRALRGDASAEVLRPTELVHEAFLRLVDGQRVDWSGRSHFMAVAAKVMRNVLVDFARARRRQKRSGVHTSEGLERLVDPSTHQSYDLLVLDEALRRLAERSPQQARVIELRFFAGLKYKEIAHVVGLADHRVKASLRLARVWLLRELQREQET